jgi:hypothetical protein
MRRCVVSTIRASPRSLFLSDSSWSYSQFVLLFTERRILVLDLSFIFLGLLSLISSRAACLFESHHLYTLIINTRRIYDKELVERISLNSCHKILSERKLRFRELSTLLFRYTHNANTLTVCCCGDQQ